MIECSNEECPNGDWFHLPCVLLTDETVPDEEWFCTDTCRDNVVPRGVNQCNNINHDHVYNYTSALLWKCLNDLVRHDAVKENDGPIMIEHWTLDMLDFWKKNHYKYMILGHRLIAGVNGWLPQNMANEIVWNRTVNLMGGSGRNIPMDLATEFLNNEFKDSLKHSRGRYTELQVKRLSQMGGSFGNTIDNLYQKNIAETHVRQSEGGKPNYNSKLDVKKFVAEYKEDMLFDKLPGRNHTAFPGYHFSTTVKKPSGYIKRLKKYSKKLDKTHHALTLTDGK
ncbi:uncharacterized protein LOC144453084 [Glandiceps talaboti]